MYIVSLMIDFFVMGWSVMMLMFSNNEKWRGIALVVELSSILLGYPIVFLHHYFVATQLYQLFLYNFIQKTGQTPWLVLSLQHDPLTAIYHPQSVYIVTGKSVYKAFVTQYGLIQRLSR